MRRPDLIFHGGGEALLRYGTFLRKTHPSEDVAEVHTRVASANATGKTGASQTFEANVPRVEWLDLDGDGVYETAALLLDTVDEFYVEWPFAWREMTIYTKAVQLGAITAGVRLWHIGTSVAATDPRLTCRIGSTTYGIEHDNGTTTPSVNLGAAPSVNDVFETRCVLRANGSVLIGQSVEAAAETTAEDATAAPFGARLVGGRLYLNSAGSTNKGNIALISAIVALGDHSMAEVRAV